MKRLLLSATACSVFAMTGCTHMSQLTAHKTFPTDSITVTETVSATPPLSPTPVRQSQAVADATVTDPETFVEHPSLRLAVPTIHPVAYVDQLLPATGEPTEAPPDETENDAPPLNFQEHLRAGFKTEAKKTRETETEYDLKTHAGDNSVNVGYVFNSVSIPPIVSSDCSDGYGPGMTGVIVGQATYTLTDVEQIALSNHPAISAASATRSKAAGLRQQVGTRPNPTLGYFGQQLADRNTDQHGIFIEQEFVRGNKLALNREVLGHTSHAQSMELETQRYRVLTDVRVRFFEALAAQQRVEATRQFSQVAKRGVEVAVDRERAEEGTLIETLQAKTLLSEIQLAAEQAEYAYLGAWRDLAAIAGIDSEAPVTLAADFDHTAVTPEWQSTYAMIVSQSPELSAARAIVCEKQALLKRQQVQYVPNVTAQLGAGYDVGTDNGMINVQLTAPIPVWNKNDGNISAAYAEYVRATQEVKRIEQSIKSRLARTAQEFDSALASVRKYEEEILPQAQKSLDLSEEAYRAGELEFLQVLVVRRKFYEASIQLIDAKGRLAGATAKVDGLLLTGGLESPTDYTDGDGIRGASFGGQ